MNENEKPTETPPNPQPPTEIAHEQNISSQIPQALQPAMVDGKVFEPKAPIPNTGIEEITAPKPSKWRYFFMILGAIQIFGVASFFFIMSSVAGQTGSEFIALALFATVVPAVGIVALVNLIGLPIYLKNHRPKGTWLIVSGVSLLVSLILALFGMFMVYQLFIAGPRYMNERSEQSRQRIEKQDQQFAADNAKPEITKAEAIELLQTCKLKGFYYTNQTDKSNPANGGWGELSSTGVVLTKVDGAPYRISISDALVPELVPIAREAQKTCISPQFWHDGSYEQYKNGKWYFGNEIVNDVQSGKSKEEALNLLANCKVDYFVGYTGDVATFKEESTRAWLKKAEESTSGIEISENSPATYVFVSKSNTSEMQNTARQYRQTCYTKKKLYIVIDGWIETEYPLGTWTRKKI